MKHLKQLIAGLLSAVLLTGSVFLPAGAIQEPLRGDIDQDGSVTVTDVVELRNLILSGIFTENTKKRADITGDGQPYRTWSSCAALLYAAARRMSRKRTPKLPTASPTRWKIKIPAAR